MAILQGQIYKQICCNKALAWGLDSFSSGSDFYLSVALGKLVSLFSFILVLLLVFGSAILKGFP